MDWSAYNVSLVRRGEFCWISQFLMVGTVRLSL